MQVQKILPTLQSAAKKISPSASIKKTGNAFVKSSVVSAPNGNKVSAFVKTDGTYGVGVSFKDTGCAGMSGRVMVDGELVPFHAQLEPGLTPTEYYGEVVSIIKEFNAGKCKDITAEVLSGKY